MKTVIFNDTSIQRFKKFRSTDGLTIDRKEGGQPVVELVMKVTPGDAFPLCDEQADLECRKVLHVADGKPRYRFLPAEKAKRGGPQLNSGE